MNFINLPKFKSADSDLGWFPHRSPHDMSDQTVMKAPSMGSTLDSL